MSITFQRQSLIVASGIFGLGVALGFTWALIRPHRLSEYRRALADETNKARR